MNRSRSPSSITKQSSVASVSSHVPLMTTSKTDETYLLTQPLMNTNTTADIHNSSQTLPMSSTRESKRAWNVCQPKGTVPYTVADNDTLEKVALRFNATPSELLKLNKLNSRMIFPGQILFVPEERSSDNIDRQQSTISSPSALTKAKDDDAFVLRTDRTSREISSSPRPLSYPQSQQDVGPMVWSLGRQINARPGRAHRLKSEPSTDSEPSPKTIEERLSTQEADNDKEVKTLQRSLSIEENHQLDDDCLQRFIKLQVRLMTEDRQSVGGTLLVTPNAVMFDPDVLDPLIKTHGIEKYGLIIRMEFLAGIALYEDLAMCEHEATVRDKEKRRKYHSISVKNRQSSESIIPLKTDEEQIHDVMLYLLDQIDKEFNPSSTTDTCLLFNASSTLQRPSSDDNALFLSIPQNEKQLDDSFQLLDENQNFNHVPTQSYHLENCVPIDQFNKRFDEIDKLLYQQHKNYSTPHSIEIPYYLCIRTSMHTHDIPSLYPRQYKRSSEINTDNVYGQKQLEYEYWFAVPKDKIDHLYSFFLQWTPERELNPLIDDDHTLPSPIEQSKANDKSPNKGFVLLVSDDPELTDEYGKNKKQQNKSHYLKRQISLLKDWEIISVDEIYRRINSTHAHSTDPYNTGIPAPKLLQQSTLINEEQAKQILLELPNRLHALDWFMTFSTETHGFSLNQLYRRSVDLDRDLPSLLLVKDVEQNVFGAFVPHQLMLSDGFYGTGESFLFTFSPEFRVFNWSGCNEFFVKGDLHSLGFGSGEGTYGLWIDADLYHGRTSSSKTFNSEPLTCTEDFLIASIEVWTFVD